MAQEVLLPKLGLTMKEGTILEWVAQSGDVIKTGDLLLRLATDKVDVDVEAEGDGRFEPVASAGATLPPGSLIAWLLSGDELAPTGPVDLAAGAAAGRQGDGRLLASPNARRVAEESSVDLTALRGSGPGGRIVSEDVEEELARQQAAPVALVAPARPSDDAPFSGRSDSPLVRRHASVSGIDLATVRGTGLSGRIRRADVDAAAEPAAAPAVAAPAGPRAGQVVPLTGMRGAIARSMHASLQEMAQLTHGYEAEVGDVMALRERLKVEWAGSGVRVPTINDFVVRAVGHALLEHPMLNATIRDGAIHLLEQVHVGIAVAVPGGLVVPVVRDVDRRTLVSIAAQTRALADAARDGTLTLSQLEGATFVVSSLGSYGVDFFTPVVNPGNTGILGVGRVRDGVRWEGDVPHRTSVLTLSLSFDHRAVDGAPAAEFLRLVSGLLTRPLLLLAALSEESA